MIRSMRDFLSLPLKNLEKKCQDTCFYSVIWSLWKARNDLNFNNAVTEWELTTTDLAKIRVALWIKGLNNITDYSVEDFKGNQEDDCVCCSSDCTLFFSLYFHSLALFFFLVLYVLGLQQFVGLGLLFFFLLWAFMASIQFSPLFSMYPIELYKISLLLLIKKKNYLSHYAKIHMKEFDK